MDTIYGGYSDRVHLFPFRTEKLSLSAQMVLLLQAGEYVVAIFISPNRKIGAFFCSYILSSPEALWMLILARELSFALNYSWDSSSEKATDGRPTFAKASVDRYVARPNEPLGTGGSPVLPHT